MSVRMNMHEAKSNLSRLVALARAGEEVIICNDGEPAAALVPVPAVNPRRGGQLAGQIWLADDWDSDEVNAEIADLFENSEIFPPES
jgi:prevent-host-death family protein